MHQEYLKLFQEIASTVATLSDQINNNKSNTDQNRQSAQTMKKYYREMYDKLKAKDFDYHQLTKADFARLLVGASILTTQIENRIKMEENALKGYKEDLLPKLDKIVHSEEDANIVEMIENFF